MNIKNIKEYVTLYIPNAVFWTTVLGIIGGIIAFYSSLRVKISTIDSEVKLLRTEVYKDIDLMRIQIELENKYVKEATVKNLNQYEQIQNDLNQIKNALNLKQDKKFVE